MNSLNPNIKEALLSSTDFTETQIKIAFELCKKIETDTHRKFTLTEEKFILFVERCRDRKWPCDQVASKLAARVVLLNSMDNYKEQTRNYGFTEHDINMDGLKDFMGWK